MNREYHYIGQLVTQEHDGSLGVAINATTNLFACGECGCVVAGGMSQNLHGLWHTRMAQEVPSEPPY